MSRRGAGTALRAGILAVTGLMPAPALPETGLEFRPSLGVTRLYDDNLFAAAADRQSDFVLRATPGLDAGYHGATLALDAHYAFDAERFERHPELDDGRMRQRAALDLRAPVWGRWSATLDAAYADTMTPGELNVETGLLVTRARARRTSLAPVLAFQTGASGGARAGYTFTHDTLAGGAATDAGVASLSFDHGLSPRDTLHLEVLDRRYSFTDAAGETGGTITSRALTLGWTREAGPRTTFTLRAGPRLTEGSVAPEASASIRFALRHGEIAADYTDSLTTIVGQAGAADFRSLALRLAGRPRRGLSVSLAPGWVRVRNDADGSVSEVLQAGLQTTWTMTRWLSLSGSIQHSRQRSAAGAGPELPPLVARDVVLVSLVAAVP